MIFKDRKDAGKKLVPKLEQYRGNKDAIVLGLPRGGVVTAFEVAEALKLPLDVMAPRKIGAPDNPEFAIGAISEEGEGVFDPKTISLYNISQEYIERETKKEKEEALHRLKYFRGARAPLDLSGKTAILIDDGVATGATMRAAVKSAKAKKANKIIVAIPTIAPDSLKLIQGEVDEVVYLDTPKFFAAVGQFYEVFPQTEDEEVVSLMEKSRRRN
jgi:putative phosphoribosyl transferase